MSRRKPPANTSPPVRKRIPKTPHPQPWTPFDWDPADAYAIQALYRGDADPHQQQRAIKLIVEDLCGTYDLSFRPDTKDAPGSRATDFAEGKRFVGTQIVKLLKINLAAMRKDDG